MVNGHLSDMLLPGSLPATDFALCLYRPRRSVANNPSFVYAFYLAYAWLVIEALVLEVSLMADVYRPPFALF